MALIVDLFHARDQRKAGTVHRLIAELDITGIHQRGLQPARHGADRLVCLGDAEQEQPARDGDFR